MKQTNDNYTLKFNGIKDFLFFKVISFFRKKSNVEKFVKQAMKLRILKYTYTEKNSEKKRQKAKHIFTLKLNLID